MKTQELPLGQQNGPALGPEEVWNKFPSTDLMSSSYHQNYSATILDIYAGIWIYSCHLALIGWFVFPLLVALVRIRPCH